MVKIQKKNTKKSRSSKGFNKYVAKARKINPSTHYETFTEQLSPFGGVLSLIIFFDLVNFQEIFSSAYIEPTRKPELGHYLMFTGILIMDSS